MTSPLSGFYLAALLSTCLPTDEPSEARPASSIAAALFSSQQPPYVPVRLDELTRSGELPSDSPGPADSDEDEDPLVTDRPDFTEASSVVPLGRLQLESGYTFTYDRDDGVRSRTHTFPELLFRYGLTENLELRLGWSYAVENNRNLTTRRLDSIDGANDLYLGIGVALSEACGLMPESKINLQATAPTGADAFSSDKFNPGINVLYSWELSDFLALGMSSGVNTASEDDDDFVVFHQSVTVGYSLTEQLGAFTELYGLWRTDSASNFPENYFDAGITYLVTKDLQLDIRAGWGLNDHAADFFTGAGFAIRF